MEIERKFLVRTLPAGFTGKSGAKIRQGYFPLRSGKGIEIRLREKSAKCFITIKAGGGKTRQEEEIGISQRRFKTLWPLVRGASLVKTRYRVHHLGRTVELDIFRGRHRGLVLADIEFRSVREADSFKPPAWLGREVTNDARYANESLARRGPVR